MPEGTTRIGHRPACTGSRCGAGCDRVGRSGEGDDHGRFARREMPPYRYDEDFLARFNARYGQQVYADIDRFDRAGGNG